MLNTSKQTVNDDLNLSLTTSPDQTVDSNRARPRQASLDRELETRVLKTTEVLEQKIAEFASIEPVTGSLLSTLDDFQRVKEEWNQLAPDPMSSFGWNFSWWKAFSDSGQLQLLKFNQDERAIGFAPFYVDRWFGLKRLRFLASGDTCTDYTKLICNTENRDLCELAFTEHIRNERFDVLEFECTENDQLATSMRKRFESTYRSDHREAEPCWILNLPTSWQDLKANAKSSLRRKINKAERRITSSEFEITSTNSGLAPDKAFEILKELHTKRWASMGKAGIFDDSRVDLFLRSAVHELASNGGIEIVVVWHNDRPIGAQLYFDASNGYQLYQSGYCPDAMKLEPGHMLFTHMTKRAIERGDTCFDFLRGNEPYKAFWGATRRSQKTLRMVSKRVVPTLVATTVNQLRNLIRPSKITGG
jgi:CelD/BcsL family acetyltransferase involved in cellulose biosynthesis